jgi:hypothetical protein
MGAMCKVLSEMLIASQFVKYKNIMKCESAISFLQKHFNRIYLDAV